MFRILIVAHTPLASGYLKAAQDILGTDIPLYGYDTDINKSPEERQSDFQNMVDDLVTDKELLILADFLGGTPSNLVLPYLGKEGIEIVTGFNMPLVFKSVTLARASQPVAAAAALLVEYASQHIKQVSAILNGATA